MVASECTCSEALAAITSGSSFAWGHSSFGRARGQIGSLVELHLGTRGWACTRMQCRLSTSSVGLYAHVDTAAQLEQSAERLGGVCTRRRRSGL
ncbi:hypothetical protein P171DRAFT_225334 [Karstenula rhodostoma CBS 690.94]|uniref:Uncharacterized protein n=1 Tax=Karstenula rhodostoma CBS 690.94 TaxID=1392251 RepID=A0A9P4PNH6_9PLEO|nr:hypothetical protein P171DRAFT_225334 [Karstenula rhodostoma CBS 690.94]